MNNQTPASTAQPNLLTQCLLQQTVAGCQCTRYCELLVPPSLFCATTNVQTSVRKLWMIGRSLSCALIPGRLQFAVTNTMSADLTWLRCTGVWFMVTNNQFFTLYCSLCKQLPGCTVANHRWRNINLSGGPLHHTYMTTVDLIKNNCTIPKNVSNLTWLASSLRLRDTRRDRNNIHDHQ